MGESRHRRTSPKDNLEIPNSPIKRKHDKDGNESDGKKQRLEEIPQTGEGYCEFSEFKIPEEIQKLLNQNGITKLFPIQSLTYNKISNGKDIIGRAMTGQGKTLAFVLPLMEKVRRSSNKPKEPTILVLTPTRELAKQISHDFEMYGPHLKTLTVYGGTEYYGQERDLRNGVDVIVGTPGRILDHMEKGNLVITNLQYLILDEADRMLDMGFQDDMDKVFHNIDNKDKQILLFSATLPDWVHNVAQKFMKSDFEIIDLVGDKKASNSVEHLVVKCQWDQRPSLINDLISIYCRPNGRCIIFCDTKIECNDLINDTSFVHTCRPLHGDIPQATREKTLEAFQQNKFKCLVATDVAARGLHIDNIDLVINKSPPSTNITFKADIDTYVHRSGRTGRAGYKGICVTLYTSKQEQVVQTIEHTLGNKFKRISPPQPKDIAITSAKQRIKDMKLIKTDILEIFKSSAEKCIKKYGPVEGVCRCLALLTGTTDEIKERSILGGRMDYITILFTCKEPMRTLSYTWGALRKLFTPEVVETVSSMSMLKDEKGALFDIPLKYYPNFEAEFQKNYTPFSRCETLPELKEFTNNSYYSKQPPNQSNSFRGGRNSIGGYSRGRSRGGGSGGRQSFGGGRNGDFRGDR